MTHSLSYRRLLSKMGYYNYQNGLIYNHLRQEGGWDNHLEKCRRFILRAMDFHKPQKITVLGSGWLLDLPLAEMIERTKEICLVDIIHPPGVISQTGNLKNVVLIEEDVTGGLIEEIWQKTRKYSFFRKMKSLENITIREYEPDFNTGMIISLNILTQLESLIIDYLKKRSEITEEEFNRFRTDIQKKHMDFLKKHKSVLITDYAEIITNNSGNILTIPTLFADIPPGNFSEDWSWNIDIKGAEFYTRKSMMRIMAVTL